MRGRFSLFLVVPIAFLLLLVSALSAVADQVPRVSTDELKSRLGEAGLFVLDVRSPHDWADSDQKIKGAERVSPAEVDQWASQYSKGDTIILYCA